jgi:hypothetical protein
MIAKEVEAKEGFMYTLSHPNKRGNEMSTPRYCILIWNETAQACGSSSAVLIIQW